MGQKLKNIGLLTMPVKENYGGIIQVAALYHFLEKQGYLPTLIMKKYDESPSKVLLRFLLTHNPLYFIYDYKNLTKREKQSSTLVKFVDDFFVNKTKPLYNTLQYKKATSHFDAVVVGSDQVWRYKYVKNNYSYYFLDFLPQKTRKIAYAASFGVDEWEGDAKTVRNIKNLLKGFNAISVREKTGIDICRTQFDITNAVHVLDPTFLPEIDFYNEIIDRENISKKVNLFTYVLDNSHYVKDIIDHTAGVLNLEISTIKLTDYKFGANPSLAEWLYSFREAEFVVTDSFHGVVFCILFKKQFICIANKKRGYTRFESLLRLFGLEDRLILDFNTEELSRMILSPINYDKVELLKIEQKRLSERFLLEALD